MNRTILIAIVGIVAVALIIFALKNPGQCSVQKGAIDVAVEQTQQDPAIRAEIDSSHLAGSDLVVKFHHSASGEQPVSVIGSVSYELSKNTAKRCEQLTLTVRDWNENATFELKIGQQSDKFRFGVLRELRETKARWTENSKTFQHYENGRPTNKFTTITSVEKANYMDEAGQWQEINTNFQQKGNRFVADRMDHEVEAGDKGVLIKKNDFSLAFSLPGKAEPEIDGNKVTYNYDDYTISWYATAGGTKNEIAVKKNLGTKTFRFRVEKSGIYLSATSDGTVNIISDGQIVGAIQRPYIIDANGNVITDRTSVALIDEFYELTVNDDGIAAPYTIDPTVRLSVAASADDADECQAEVLCFDSDEGTISMVSATNTGTRKHAGFRFPNVNVPQGADVTAATLELYVPTVGGSDDPDGIIYANDVDSANDFSTEADVTSRVTTTASVSWSQTDMGIGTYITSPDINAVVQEITDRSGWRSGNAMVILAKGGTSASTKNLRVLTADGGASVANLSITYTLPSLTFQNPTPVNNTYRVRNFVEVNVSTSREVDTCNVEWTDVSGVAKNETIETRFDNTNTYCYVNKTYLGVGNYSYRVFGTFVNGSIISISQTRHAFINQSGLNFTVPTPENSTIVGADHINVNLTHLKDVNASPEDTSMYIDLNNTLKLYLSMDHIRNAANDNISRDNSTFGHNATFYNMGSNIYGNTTKCSHNEIPGKSVEAKFGGACLFDGTADHITVNNSDYRSTIGINGTGLTVELWFRANNPLNGVITDLTGQCRKQCLISKSNGGTNTNADYSIGVGGSGNKKIIGLVGSSAGNTLVSSSFDVAANKWYHVAMVFNGTIVKLYVDGVLNVSSSSFALATARSIEHANVTVGAAGTGTSGAPARFFNGTIDEVRIYSRELSIDEIKASMNASLYRLEANFTNLTQGNYSISAGYTNLTGRYNRTPTWNVSVGTINNCRTITSNGNYSLANAVSSNGGACINISRTVTNLTLDCRNYTITYGGTALGYAFNISSNSTLIKNCNIVHGGSTAGSHAVLFNDYTGSVITLQNSTIHTAAATSKAAFIMGNGTYTFMNVSFQKERIAHLSGAKGNLSVKWYLDVYVNDSGGNAISGARVDAVNKSTCGSDKCIAFNTTTGADGFIRNIELTEFVNNSNVNYTATNYTLTASNTGFGGVTKQLNLTNSTFINLQLTDQTPPNITFEVPTPQNGSYSTNFIYINISVNDTASDIDLCTLDWNGVNETMSKNATSNATKNLFCYVNKTGLSEGLYTARVWASDSPHNNKTVMRNFRIDTTAPASLSFISPTDANDSAWFRNSTYINTSFIESNENDTIRIEWNGTNITLDDSATLVVMSLDNNTADVGRYNNSGTAFGDINCSTGISGQRGGTACKFGGGNSYIKINYNESLYRGTQFTASFWMKLDKTLNFQETYYPLGSSDFSFFIQNALDAQPYYCGFSIALAGGGTPQAEAFSCVSANTWYYVTLTWDGSTVRILLNGTVVATASSSGPRREGTSAVYIGSSDGTSNFLNGTIDELEIYGRVLSSAEIANRINGSYPDILNGTFRAGRHFFNYTNIREGQYNYTLYVNDTANNTGVSVARVFTVDRTNVTMAFASPTQANGTYGYGYINVNMSVNDTTATGSCLLEWNGVNETMGKWNLTDRRTVAYCFTNKTSLAEGNYTYRIWANDTANNTNVGAQRHVFMDLTGPVLNFQGPMVPNGSYNFNYLYINVSANDSYSNINSCTLELGIINPNSNNLTNESMSLVGSGKNTVCFVNRTNLVDSNYTYRVFVQDSNGNTNVTPFRHMLVDKIRPTFVIPTVNGSFNLNWIFVNASTNGTSTDVDRCNLELFSESNSTRANWTLTKTPSGLENTVYCHLNVTGLPNGNFSFRVYSNDSAGNIDASEIKHQYIDTIRSALSFAAPSRISGSYNTNYVYVNISANDVQTNLTGTDIDLCNLEWNGVNESMTLANLTSNNTFCFVNKTSLGDGNYTYRVFSNDTAGNLNSSTRHAYVDTALPAINFTAPSLVNDTYVTRSLDVNVSVNGTGTDVDQCNLEWNGVNQSMAKTKHTDAGPNFYSCFITKSSLTAVNYTYRVFSNDSAGNLNASETRHANIELPTPDLRVGFSMEFNISDSSGDSASADGKGVGRYTSTSGGFSNYYVCNEDTSISKTPTFGIVFAGRQFDYAEIRSGNSFRLNISQAADGNRFIIPVTIGGCNNVKTAYSDVIRPLGAMTRAFVQFVDVTKNPVEVILSYPDIDFVGSFVKSGAFTITLEKNESGRVAQIIFRD